MERSSDRRYTKQGKRRHRYKRNTYGETVKNCRKTTKTGGNISGN
jgi:hypothetical protein